MSVEIGNWTTKHTLAARKGQRRIGFQLSMGILFCETFYKRNFNFSNKYIYLL